MLNGEKDRHIKYGTFKELLKRWDKTFCVNIHRLNRASVNCSPQTLTEVLVFSIAATGKTQRETWILHGVSVNILNNGKIWTIAALLLVEGEVKFQIKSVRWILSDTRPDCCPGKPSSLHTTHSAFQSWNPSPPLPFLMVSSLVTWVTGPELGDKKSAEWHYDTLTLWGVAPGRRLDAEMGWNMQGDWTGRWGLICHRLK